MELLFLPMNVFIAFPLAAAVIGFFFLSYYFRNRRKWSGQERYRTPKKLIIVCGCLWVAYAIWEGAMHVWAKGVVAPIRIDLLLIAPVLYAVTALGVVGWYRSWQASNGTDN